MQQETAERIKDVMSVDPISEFEVRSGKSYKTNREAENIAMMFHAMNHNALKAESLRNQGDVSFGCDVAEYLRIVSAFGFEQVLCDEFTSEKWGHQDKYLILWHPAGLLLAFDTFMGKSVNGGKVYYNWVPSPDVTNRFRYTSSGHYTHSGVWVGDHDCREGLVSNMTAMMNAGSFLTEWEQQPSLWLLSYNDRTETNYFSTPKGEWPSTKITAERISRLPEHVQKAIRGT